LEFSAKHDIVIEAYGSLACVVLSFPIPSFFSTIDVTTVLLGVQRNKRPITTYPGGPLDPVLSAIARRIGGTPGQVIFKWAHAKGFVVVTTTARRTRLDEYLDVVNLRASPSLIPPSLPGHDVIPLFFGVSGYVADLMSGEVEAIDEAGVKGPPASRRIGH
jgi:diketogulonate reductase-like aldo/keto reductase